jgi:hypothetical protein
LTANDLASIAGAYALQLPGAPEAAAATVSLGDGRLYLSAPPLIDREELVPLSPDRFLGTTWASPCSFSAAAAETFSRSR